MINQDLYKTVLEQSENKLGFTTCDLSREYVVLIIFVLAYSILLP